MSILLSDKQEEYIDEVKKKKEAERKRILEQIEKQRLHEAEAERKKAKAPHQKKKTPQEPPNPCFGFYYCY
jgi:hypothetical protein